MKKIKLITSLSTLGALTAAAPIVTTSCSSDKKAEYKNYITFRGKAIELPENLNPNFLCWVPSYSTGTYYMLIPTKDNEWIYIYDYNCDQITDLKLTSCDDTAIINNDFLSYLPNLTTVNLSGLTKVTTIGHRFLSNNFLESLDLTPLSNLNGIGDNFLSFSLFLDTTNIKFPEKGFEKLSCIGKDFMYSCFSLTSFDMSVFSYVEPEGATENQKFKIGVDLFEDCYFLESVNVNNILPDKLGYDTWNYDEGTKTWSFTREDNNDLDTFTKWSLSPVPVEKQVPIKIICDNETVKAAWNDAYTTNYKGYQLNKLNNYEWIDPVTLDTMFFGNRSLDIQSK